MRKPRIAVTLGDVTGIGPEVVARAVADPTVRQCCNLFVIGDGRVLGDALRLVGNSIAPVECKSLAEAAAEDGSNAIPVWNPVEPLPEVLIGQTCPRAGHAAYRWLVAATDAALAQEIDGIVTAPLSKAALHAAGHCYPGHTEILAERCGVKNFAMMLYLPPGRYVRGPFGLGIAHTTLHTSIASVPALLNQARIQSTVALVDLFLQRLGCSSPRIGVCALNPHAGEGGLFGHEETDVIAPAVDLSKRAGIDAIGPLPADTLIRRAVSGEFDGLTAMYHDQGHIALKLIAFGTAVNVTLGLPIVRTSPSHGTAYDIAWQGKADATGMVEAIRTAAQLALSR